MSLEAEIARLIDVVEKGFARLEADQSENRGYYQQMVEFQDGILGYLRKEYSTNPAHYPAPDPVPAAPAPASAKRGRPAAAAVPVVEPAPLPAQNASPAAPNGKGPSFDEVVAIAQELARVRTPPVAIKLINEHGAQKLADMDPARYPAFYAAAQVALSQDTSL